MSGTDDDALDSALATCGTCKVKVTPGEQTVSCGNCNHRFHIQCVGTEAAAQDGKWFCKEQICQIASMIEEEKLLALAEKIKNMEAAQKIDLLMLQKERKMLRTLELKKLEEEKKMRAEEEEEETALQQQLLKAKTEELVRKEARRKSFDDKMADLDRKLNKLKIATGGADESDGVNNGQENQSESNGSIHGLGQQYTGPTKAQLAARTGLTQKLPSFSGKPEEWPLFYGAFQASNAACGYSNVENLVRLQDCLKGYALEMVSGQLILPKSVPKVIAKLRMLFGRPEQLLQAHLDKVRNLKPPRSDKLSSFIPFGNAVEQMCEHIEAADLHQHLINPLLIQDLVDKLPDPEKRQWVRFKKRSKKVTLRTFTNFIMEIVEEACEANVALDFLSGEMSTRAAKENVGSRSCHCEEENVEAGPSEQKKLAPCQMCSSTEHRLRDCENFKKLKYTDRLQLVAREQLCNRCLNNHGGQCWFKFRCNVSDCREPHHPLMHPVETVVGVNAHICSGTGVTFRMIPVQLHCGGRSHDVLAFLDEGSSVTLIDQKLADQLELNGVPEQLTMRWTTGYQREEKQSRRMNLNVSAVGDETNGLLELHEVHTVENLLLPRQKLDLNELAGKYRHLRGLPIEPYNGKPKLLIGLNNIHAFAPAEVRTGAALEPVAVLCKLGWSVYGPKPGMATHQVNPEDPSEGEEIREIGEKESKTKKSKRKPKQTRYCNDEEMYLEIKANVGKAEQQRLEITKSGSARSDPKDVEDKLTVHRDQLKEVAPNGRVGPLVKSGFPTQTPDVTGWGVATRHATSKERASRTPLVARAVTGRIERKQQKKRMK